MIHKKSSSGESNVGKVNIYTIELDRWGIKEGLPSKRLETINSVSVNCYADADYAIALNNMRGFNSAFTWAKSQNYNRVLVPFGSYSVCYSYVSDNDKENKIVIDQSNLSIDLNGSTFKVMFDSAKRSPYNQMKSGNTFVASTNPIYEFSGGGDGPPTIMVVRDCNYTEVKNGKIIGDKIDRDFTNIGEKAMDNTYGLLAGGNCKYINIENNDVSFFMGDGLSISSGKNNLGVKTGYDMGWSLGDLDTNGSFIASVVRCVSDYIAVSPSTPHFMVGYAYTQGMTALQSRRYTVYMYDANKVLLNKIVDQFVLREFVTSKLASFVRLVVDETAVDVDGWLMQLKTGIKGSFLTFQNNYIHHNHRGGTSPGVNDMFIINNHFYNNGLFYDYENNIPGFDTSSTRYHINMEDSQGFNIQVIGNKFEGGTIGIAARGNDWIIKNNWFFNCNVTLYRLHYAILKDNYFSGSAGFNTQGYDAAWLATRDFIRNWDIEGNVFEGNFSITGNALTKNISNNTFLGMVTLGCAVDNFKNNTFNVDDGMGFTDQVQLRTLSKIESCKFIKSNQNLLEDSILLSDVIVRNCIFKNLKVRSKNVTLEGCNIADSGFELIDDAYLKMNNCKISQGTYLLKNKYAVAPNNSAVVVIKYATKIIDVEFRNCEIVSTSTQAIFGADGANTLTNANLRLENTKISKLANNNLGIGIFNGQLNFINTSISSEIAVPNITPNASLAHRFSDCTFTNVSFTVKTNDIQFTQQDIGLLARPLSGNGTPSVVPQKLGQEYYDMTNKKVYKAFGTTAVNDWVAMN